jgi:hypothetical protein
VIRGAAAACKPIEHEIEPFLKTNVTKTTEQAGPSNSFTGEAAKFQAGGSGACPRFRGGAVLLTAWQRSQEGKWACVTERQTKKSVAGGSEPGTSRSQVINRKTKAKSDK